MVLKKQTVWLLTMLSLIVVLSVYYMTSPGQSSNQMAYVDNGSQQQAKSKTDSSTNSSKESTKTKNQLTSSVSSDDMFAGYRMDRDTNRTKEIQQLQDVAASKKSSAVQVSKAMDSIHEIQSLASNESLLEDKIKSEGYNDAVVMTSGNNVNIYVESSSLSNSQANDIMRLADQYLGDRIVSVHYQKPSSSN